MQLWTRSSWALPMACCRKAKPDVCSISAGMWRNWIAPPNWRRPRPSDAMNREVDVSELIEGQKLGLYQISILVLLGAIMFFDGYDMQVLGYAAPALLKAWHLDKAAFGLAFGAGMTGFTLGSTMLGQLGASWGAKKLILGAPLLFGA